MNHDIDKVAAVIWQADRCDVARCPRKAFGWEKLDARYQARYRQMARAAIDALQLQERVQNHAGVVMRSYRTPWVQVKEQP